MSPVKGLGQGLAQSALCVCENEREPLFLGVEAGKPQVQETSWDAPCGKQAPGAALRALWCPQGLVSEAKAPGHPSLHPRERGPLRGEGRTPGRRRQGRAGPTPQAPTGWAAASLSAERRLRAGTHPVLDAALSEALGPPPRAAPTLQWAGLGLVGAQGQAHPSPQSGTTLPPSLPRPTRPSQVEARATAAAEAQEQNLSLGRAL